MWVFALESVQAQGSSAEAAVFRINQLTKSETIAWLLTK
jgi:hypothetical protein